MDRLVIWVVLGAIYGGVLYLLVEAMGQAGFVVWLAVVVVGQFLLSRRTRNY